MNRMYDIKKYIAERFYSDGNLKKQPSIDTIINLFLKYLDDNNIVYGTGEFHSLKDGKLINEPL